MTKKAGLVFLLALVVLSFSVLIRAESNFSLVECKSECRAEKDISRDACKDEWVSCLNDCNNVHSCKRSCNIERNSCIKESTKEYNWCTKICLYTSRGKNTTCLEGKYQLGETFAQGCDECTCGVNGAKCKKTAFCNFENVSIDETQCVNEGGLYYALCNGPYFGIVCSSQKFCLCGGNDNYSCPDNSFCVYEFISPNKRTSTIPGWRTLLGQDLGTIGICAHLPVLENCGNGVCENKICKNCPTPETKINCAADCQ